MRQITAGRQKRDRLRDTERKRGFDRNGRKNEEDSREGDEKGQADTDDQV